MADTPRFSLATVVLDCPDAHALADFYRRLLGWEVALSEPDWVLLRCPTGGTQLSFQSEADYRPPVWPERPGAQQKMLHLDIQVDDLKRRGRTRSRPAPSWPSTSRRMTCASTWTRPATRSASSSSSCRLRET